jgi:hypothetical protein
MIHGASVSPLLLQEAINLLSSLFLVCLRFIFSSVIFISVWFFPVVVFFFFFSFRVFFFTFVNYKRWVVVETDLCIDFEDIEEEDDDLRTEYPCPYCTDDFDLVELCFHIDEEHYLEAKSGVFYFTFLLFKNITFLLFIV